MTAARRRLITRDPPSRAYYQRPYAAGKYYAHAIWLLADWVAAIGALLGRYERSITIDRGLLRVEPHALRVWRRLVWALLRLGELPGGRCRRERTRGSFERRAVEMDQKDGA